MSVTIDLFFNHPKSLTDLGTEINACLGCSLAPYEGDNEDLFDYFMGMEFSLDSAEGYENDREVDFENFAYEIGFRVPVPNTDMRPAMLPAMALVTYTLHRWLGITGILVHDVQTLLARYEEREVPGYGRRLYDVISGTPFVDFAQHLEILLRRLPEDEERYFVRPEIEGR